MAQLTCELCGGTDLVKEGGVFVCQKCGCKYSVEDARKLMTVAERGERIAARTPAHAGPRPGVFDTVAAAAKQTVSSVAAATGVPLRMETLADFQPAGVNPALAGARAVNNYACQAWQLLIDEYAKFEHPTRQQQESLAERARECLVLLDSAAMLEPDNHPQAALIYKNCREIVQSARSTSYYEKNDEGAFVAHGMPHDVKFEPSGQKDSWEAKERAHRSPLEAQYVAEHPEDVQYREALNAQKAQLEDQLGDLKDEKRGHGFFDFAGKREVKDRMKPVKEQLSGVNAQLRALDQKPSDYADARIDEIAAGFIRLDF